MLKPMPGETLMDDFLHNLRNPNKKRYDRSKPYDGQYRGNERFSRDRKNSPQQRKPADSGQMPAIKRIMENILEQQRRLAEKGERMARAAERQADALESIARHFRAQLSAPDPARAKVTDSPAAFAAPAQVAAPRPAAAPPSKTPPPPGEAPPRQAAGAIILQQRAMGHSFEQIAQTLNAQGIATVSGKGQWRTQNVSRLYNRLTADESAAPSPLPASSRTERGTGTAQ